MQYLSEKTLSQLFSTVKSNLGCYRSGDFVDLIDKKAVRTLKGKFRVKKLESLKTRSDVGVFDAENSELVFKSLGLTPMQAREERIWAYLCHMDGLNYMRSRWPIPSDDVEAVKHIQTHFFATSARAIERDNGISRLWWMGFISSRAKGLELSETLEVLTYRADVRANIIERPTTGASVNVFSAILKQLKKSYDGKKVLHERQQFRAFMKEINSVGGVQLLDSLNSRQLNRLTNGIIKDRLGLSEI